jgi:hypothetical protein
VRSQFDDEIGPGTRCREWVFTPREYLAFGDHPIRNPPLINTSLKELAEKEWYLSVQARYRPTYGHTKIKYHFGDPDKNGNPYLVFKLWAKGNFVLLEKVNPYSLVKELVTRDLTPNFSKAAAFSLVPSQVEKEVVKEVQIVGTEITLENELEILQTLNVLRKEKLKNLRVGKSSSENPSSDGAALSRSA